MLSPNSTIDIHETIHRMQGERKTENVPKSVGESAPPKEGRKEAPKDAKAHMSLISLDNIHTISILCWRRSRYAYVAALNAKKRDEGDDDDHQWHLTESMLFILYRAVGFFVLFAQVTFLWSLLDLHASDFYDKDIKKGGFSIKYTAAMTDREFGSGPLNATIAAWDAARSASNVRQCQAWVLECGARWAAGETCQRESDISFSCFPWDYEKFLGGRNGTGAVCYRSDGAAVLGGRPYYGSMTRGVIQDWVFRSAPDGVGLTRALFLFEGGAARAGSSLKTEVCDANPRISRTRQGNGDKKSQRACMHDDPQHKIPVTTTGTQSTGIVGGVGRGG